MKNILRAILVVSLLGLVAACENTSAQRSTPDRTTPAGTARGVSTANDMSTTGTTDSPAAHRSQ